MSYDIMGPWAGPLDRNHMQPLYISYLAAKTSQAMTHGTVCTLTTALHRVRKSRRTHLTCLPISLILSTFVRGTPFVSGCGHTLSFEGIGVGLFLKNRPTYFAHREYLVLLKAVTFPENHWYPLPFAEAFEDNSLKYYHCLKVLRLVIFLLSMYV